MASSTQSSGTHHAWMAGFLGWTLDAFDFFVIVFLYDTLAREFSVTKKAIVFTTFATLSLRPVGALLFGVLADRFGRRVPLMANVIYFSVIELLCGFAPNYAVFLVLRALFGIGMGGEWGVGASLAMEAVPPRWRGVLSGILQSGYSIGYLLAAVTARFVLPTLGWRWMFWLGAVPALLALYIRTKVPESAAWKQHRVATTGQVLRVVVQHWKRFAYLAVLMTFMMFLSHGTQDLYPDFLKEIHHVAAAKVANIAIVYNIGAVLGSVIFGMLSESLGRRKGMIAALALCLLMIPAWAFGGSVPVVVVGSIILQMGVQGAWGVIPVHLNELAADAVRGLMPGLAYQLGILFASPTNTIEYALREHFGYSWALASFEVVTILTLVGLLWRGAEEHGRSFVKATAPRDGT
ncbi:MAG TPA: MFS transporter [Candidatus Limnocylindrales bacterium]|nr:MFS transporter [Candidatus Limnocylindrales bacterium]